MRLLTIVIFSAVFALSPLVVVARHDPAEAATTVPSTSYDSVFGGYQAFQERQPGSWREQNDEMGRLGGHVGHLRDSGAHVQPTAERAPSDPGVHRHE